MKYQVVAVAFDPFLAPAAPVRRVGAREPEAKIRVELVGELAARRSDHRRVLQQCRVGVAASADVATIVLPASAPCRRPIGTSRSVGRDEVPLPIVAQDPLLVHPAPVLMQYEPWSADSDSPPGALAAGRARRSSRGRRESGSGRRNSWRRVARSTGCSSQAANRSLARYSVPSGVMKYQSLLPSIHFSLKPGPVDDSSSSRISARGPA